MEHRQERGPSLVLTLSAIKHLNRYERALPYIHIPVADWLTGWLAGASSSGKSPIAHSSVDFLR
jgi:hypothetical protein